jgi:hypothetical protein
MVENQHSGLRNWCDVCVVESVSAWAAMNSIDNTKVQRMPLAFNQGDYSGARVVPSAFTVQVLNPQSLQKTEGTVYMGVMTTGWTGGAPTTGASGAVLPSWTEFGDNFVQYMSPRMLVAARLAMRGVKVNSYPLSMSQLAEFNAVTDGSPTIPADGAVWTNTGTMGLRTMGFAPIVIYKVDNASSEGTPLELEVLVTTEWRVRFDISNPACASHRQHGITSEAHWHKCLQLASSRGNGVMDIPSHPDNRMQF